MKPQSNFIRVSFLFKIHDLRDEGVRAKVKSGFTLTSQRSRVPWGIQIERGQQAEGEPPLLYFNGNSSIFNIYFKDKMECSVRFSLRKRRFLC